MSAEFWRRVAKNRLLDIGMGFIALLALGHLALALPGRVFEWDFAHYYVSSRMLLEGRDPYDLALEPESRQQGFVTSDVIPRATNPPPLLWLVAAFVWAPPRVAFWAWTTVQAISLAAVLLLTRVLLQGRLSTRAWWFFGAGVVASQAIFYHFWFGQAQLLLVALILGGFACLRRGNGMTACTLVTAAALVKLFPLVLVPWFIWRGGGDRSAFWRRVTATAATGLVVVTVTGWGLWRDFFRFAAMIVSDFAPRRTFNFTIPSLVVNLHAVASGQVTTDSVPRIWWMTAMSVGLIVILTGYWLVGMRGGDLETEFCLLCVVMLAGNPVTWGHYFVFLIFPMAVAVVKLREGLTEARLIGFALLILALNVLDLAGKTWVERRFAVAFIANYVPLAGLIVLACLFAGWLNVSHESRTKPAGSELE